MKNYYDEINAHDLIDALNEIANEFGHGFVGDNLRMMGVWEEQAKKMTDKVDCNLNEAVKKALANSCVEVKVTDYGFLASIIGENMDSTNGRDWQFSIEEVVQMIIDECDWARSVDNEQDKIAEVA